MTLGHVPMCRNLALHRLEGTPTSVQPVKPPTGPVPVETVPPDCTDFYGLAKRCGEQICLSAVAEYGMSVVALRL